MIVAEVKRCQNCGRELRVRDTEYSGQTVADTPAAPTPSNVTPFALPNAAKNPTGGFSGGLVGESSKIAVLKTATQFPALGTA